MPQALRRSLSVATATAVAASALVALGGAGVANAAAYPTINEFSNDINGSNDPEFVEIHAAPGTVIDGHSLLVVRSGTSTNGLQGNVYRSTAITGTTDANGLLEVTLPINHILNSTMTLMLVSGTAPAVNADLDSDDDGVLNENLGFTIVDSVGTTSGAGFAYGDTILTNDFDGGSSFVGGASRTVDGVDTGSAADWTRNAYSGFGFPDRAYVAGDDAFMANTPGQPNRMAVEPEDEEEPPVEPGQCDAVATPIGTVQGMGDVSPYANQTATVEGVVTAVQPGLSGVTIQSIAPDADPATSEGLFVFSSAAATQLAVGNHVQITGQVTEYFGQTQIAGTTRTLCAEAVEVPAPVELTLPLEAPESLESTLVTFPADLTIIETFEYARYGTLALGTGSQSQPTDVLEPGSAEAVALLEANMANRILLDDAVSSQNPDPARHPNGQPYTLDNRFRAGDLVTGATGTLGYGFDAWRIQPTVGATVTTVNERPEVPQVGGDLQVAAFNVLNYFTDLNGRGATTPQELERQTAKIVSAIVAMDADIVGLMEIENGGDALSTLVAAINAQTDRPYTAIETGAIGTDEIATALIYRADAVTPEGAWLALGHGSETDPGFDPARHRPALTQSFAITGTDEVLTVSVNHLKSKGSACGPIDPNGQGNCNVERTEAATALADWLATDPTNSGSTHSMIIGDLNAYAMEDPIVALQEAGYTDLLPTHDGPGEYTYTFDGMLGSLDHALASASVAPLVTDAAAWHTNTDEVSLIDYTMQFKQPAQDAIFAPDPFRASDHDAVLVGLAFEGAEPEPEPEVEVTTYAGADRYAANVAVSQDQFEAGSPVFLASGQVFADALTAGPAAAHEGASLLLTTPGSLPAATLAELDRLAPPAITIVGGPASVSDAVLTAIEERFPEADVTRIGGADRYEVAAAVATEVFGTSDSAFVASGEVFADALSASGVAATSADVPVLLSTSTGLPTATSEALASLGATDAYVIGGRSTLRDAVVGDVRDVTGWALRISGSDRYAVNAALVERFVPFEEQQGTIVVASGAVFADALSATAAAGVTSGPLLLTPGQCTTLDVRDVIDQLDPAVVLNVGGPATLSPEAWRSAC